MTAIPKPTRAARKAKKADLKREKKRTRRQACEIVWRREGGSKERDARCERCKEKVSRDVHPVDDLRAHFNERLPKSLGGDPTDPANIELCCRKCHFGGPSGAHAPTPDRMET